MSTNHKRLHWTALTIAVLGAWALTAQNGGDALRRGFENPPDSAKPRVWWHWMNGNITKEGIQADLEWMKRVGIGGFQNFDAALSTPQIVDHRLVYMTPEWKDAFRYAATLADQLGLEMAIAGSPGWSESGGPWVTPAQAMKKLVWSETRVEGGRPFTGVLPKPPSTTGLFQNIPRPGPPTMYNGAPAEYYGDSQVVAFRAPGNEIALGELEPKVTSSGGHFEFAALTDGDLARTTALPAAPAGGKAWIQFEFTRPQTVRALTVVASGGAELEAGDDGAAFRSISTVAGNRGIERTISFPAVTARFFRVTFSTSANATATPADFQVAELALHPDARVNRFEEKAAFAATPDLYASATPPVAAADAIRKQDTIDLTARMQPDGKLDWTPPPGRWVVLRMGYSLTGSHNNPASPEATGLEVDKLSSASVKAYFTHYLDMYKETLGPLMGKRGLEYIVTDSWEAGVENWTGDMIAQFSKRRGYDPRPWLPVLAGRVVESAEASDRFLWDFRKTIADLTAECHYDQLTTLLGERGMARYSESHESGRAFIADGMEVKRTAAVPMSAMWTQRPGVDAEQYGYNADIRESASVAHIYGQNLVAAESLTASGSNGAWVWSPETLKPTADKELAMGLNRFVIHSSVHQPVSDKIPGLGLGPYGQWFTRHETWAELARPWITYLARSSYMLQQGKFVADVLYYYGEDSNLTAIFRDHAPDIPVGYDFDYTNADALVHLLTVKDGKIVTPSGMSYRVLALDPRAAHMSLEVLRKIRDLANAGAVVVGAKPTDDPSLSDDPAEFHKIADELWDKGRVHAQTLAEALPRPDFEYTKPQPDTNLLFVHRALPDGEVYWVDNRKDRAEQVDATFRVAGKAPELWRPETGKTEPASFRTAGGRTTVPLRLNPYEAVFVVFRGTARTPSRTLPEPVETRVGGPEGGWDVGFQPNRGAPAKIAIDRLSSWSESSDPGVKYFSGTATYTGKIQAPAAWFQKGARLWLDLGSVKNLAEVWVNGKPLGVVWKTPFRVDATEALTPGANLIEVKVTNLWVNRLIGDQQPDASKKYTYTTQPFYKADSPLLPSGLLGPVEVVRVKSRP
ncbi:MAG: glycosyl hydrolase [Bryobacteraceae bacterium]